MKELNNNITVLPDPSTGKESESTRFYKCLPTRTGATVLELALDPNFTIDPTITITETKMIYMENFAYQFSYNHSERGLSPPSNLRLTNFSMRN